MAQKQTIKKSDILQQISNYIKKCDNYLNQVPYQFAQDNVRRILSNPCLSGKFYLNALYKQMQSEWSADQAEHLAIDVPCCLTYDEVINDPNIKAYVVAYKQQTTKNNKLQELKQEQAQQLKKIQNQSQEQKNALKQEQSVAYEKLYVEQIQNKGQTTFQPYIFLGPYTNYKTAESAFKNSNFSNSIDLKTQNTTKTEFSMLGLLPTFHNVGYITTQSLTYYIYLDFTDKIKQLQTKVLEQNNVGITDQREQYITSEGYELFAVRLPRTQTIQIVNEFSQNDELVDKSSQHMSLKNDRDICTPENLYNFTKYISEQSNDELLSAERNVISLYNKKERKKEQLNKLLKNIQEKQQSSITSYYYNQLYNALPSYITAGKDTVTNNLVTLNQSITNVTRDKNQIKNLENQISILEKQISQTTDEKQKKALNEQLNNTKQSLSDQQEWLEIHQKQLQQAKANNNNLNAYNDAKQMVDEYLKDLDEQYKNAKEQASLAQEKSKKFIEEFVAADNYVTINIRIRPRQAIKQFMFQTLASNHFKPVLDKKMQEIKNQYEITKVYKTDSNTGRIIKPLVEAGQLYPNDWPYKNLYIDTVDYNEWLDLKDQLQILYDKYLMLQDEIPLPDEEQPTIKQTFGSGANVQVIQQPPPDPWCDKYFPKNYAQLFGVPDILPSLLKIDELIFDNQKKPVMIDDPTGAKDENGKIKQVQKTIKHPVSIQNGYAYVDIGKQVTLCYTILPLLPNSILIPGVGKDYGAIIAGYFTPLDAQAVQLVTTYPYQNDQKDGKVWWMQADSAVTIYKALTGQQPIMMRFKIYLKYNIRCGYPKRCGNLSTQQMELNGKCGLEEFLSKPLIIDTQGLGQATPRSETGAAMSSAATMSNLAEQAVGAMLGKAASLGAAGVAATSMLEQANRSFNFLNYQQQQSYNNIKTEINNWKYQSNNMVNEIKNFKKNILINNYNKNVTLQNFTDILTELAPSLSDLIPPDCMNVICDAQRQALQDDSIESFSDSVKNNVNAAALIVKDSIKSVADQGKKIVQGMGNLATTTLQSVKNLYDTFSLYQLCARRFNDYLKDANPIGDASPIPLLNKNGFKIPDKLNVFAQLQNIFAKDIIGGFMGLLDNCITRNATKLQIMDSPLIPGNVKQMLYSANTLGNALTFHKILQAQGLDMETIINTSNLLGSTGLISPQVNSIVNNSTIISNTLGNGFNNTSFNTNYTNTIQRFIDGSIGADQIQSVSNNSVVNLNGVNIAKDSLNSLAIKNNILSNANASESLINALNANANVDLSGGITDLELAAQNILDDPTLSGVNSNIATNADTIQQALAETKAKINNSDTSNNISQNRSYMSVADTIQARNNKWIFETTDDLNSALAITEQSMNLNKYKDSGALLQQIGTLGSMITTKMIQKVMRNAVNKAAEQAFSNMSEVDNVQRYIDQKNAQYERINKGK